MTHAVRPHPKRADDPPPLLGNALLFGRVLRSAGLPVSPDRSLAFARALEWVDVGDRRQVFYAARSMLVSRREDLGLFAELFAAFWRAPGASPPGAGRSAPTPSARRQRPLDVAGWMAERARRGDPEVEAEDRSRTFSAAEALRHKEFADLTDGELSALRRLIAERAWPASLRRTRRRAAARRGGELDLRRVLREAGRHGGVPLTLRRRRRKLKQRPLVLLADVSGSMERTSRILLELFYAISHGLGSVECFAFGTRLTRITPQLRLRNADRALAEAGREVVDWAGGTRIGECLGAFNRRWARRVLRRGALVLIASDGWDRGDTARLVDELTRLRRRCHRLLWLNPLAGRDGYRPLVEGMAAALPLVDDFLPIHDLASLDALARRLGELPARRPLRPGGRGALSTIRLHHEEGP